MPTSINYSQIPQSASRPPPKPSRWNTKNFFRGFLLFSILVIATVITLYFTTDVFKKTTAIPVITTVTSGTVTTTTVTSTTVTSTTITTTTVTTSNYCENDTYCRNGAYCVNALSGGGKQCDCLPGFNGTDCGNDINDCLRAGETCNHRGTCIDGYGNLNSSTFNYTCECDAGFEGQFCKKNINDCLPTNPCYNGATCTDGVGNFNSSTLNVTCDCMPGYSGPFCESVSTTSTTHTTTTVTTTTITTTTDTTVTTNTLSTSTVSTLQDTFAYCNTSHCAKDCNATDCGLGCSGTSCATGCTGNNCGAYCTNVDCADLCQGNNCGQNYNAYFCAVGCRGQNCAQNCIGQQCAVYCTGDNCGNQCIGAQCANPCTGNNCGSGCAHPPTPQGADDWYFRCSPNTSTPSITMGISCNSIQSKIAATAANTFDAEMCNYLNHPAVWPMMNTASTTWSPPANTEQCYKDSTNGCTRTTLDKPVLMCTLPGKACNTPGLPLCSSTRPCGKCQGHCSNHDDCRGDLECNTNHTGPGDIPGCSEHTPSMYYETGKGYCYDPPE